MESYVWWVALEVPGLEQLHLVKNETGIIVDSFVLGIEGVMPFRLWYQVWTDNNWNVRECFLQLGGEKGQTVHLYADGQGHWTDDAGVARSDLDGCLDIDISHTPFTNTLPLRRLELAPGESAHLLVAYAAIPDLVIRPARQRYTCLSRTTSGGLYRYEGLENNFTADLPVDDQGLIVDYPGIWKRQR
ncbi:MAG TPA: putative glycolipid-binding domain-containing protein [Ktedonobacteraceae bacterium]